MHTGIAVPVHQLKHTVAKLKCCHYTAVARTFMLAHRFHNLKKKVDLVVKNPVLMLQVAWYS